MPNQLVPMNRRPDRGFLPQWSIRPHHIRLTFVMIVLATTCLAGAPAAFADDRNAAGDRAAPQADESDAAGDRPGMFATEVWLTPLVLLPGVALLIVSTSARFGQLHTEFYRLLDHPDAHARILAQHLMKRCALFRDSLVALYAGVGLFAFGSLLGGVVNLWRPESLWVVGSSTMIGIGCIVYAAVQLVREALVCLRVLVDHNEALQNGADEN